MHNEANSGEINADRFLRHVSRLVTRDDILMDLGTHLEFTYHQVQAIRTDNRDSIQMAGFSLLLKWRRTILKTVDIAVIKDRLTPVMDDLQLLGEFIEITCQYPTQL